MVIQFQRDKKYEKGQCPCGAGKISPAIDKHKTSYKRSWEKHIVWSTQSIGEKIKTSMMAIGFTTKRCGAPSNATMQKHNIETQKSLWQEAYSRQKELLDNLLQQVAPGHALQQQRVCKGDENKCCKDIMAPCLGTLLGKVAHCSADDEGRCAKETLLHSVG